MARLQKKNQNNEFPEEMDDDLNFDEIVTQEEAEKRFKANDKKIRAEKKKLLKFYQKLMKI